MRRFSSQIPKNLSEGCRKKIKEGKGAKIGNKGQENWENKKDKNPLLEQPTGLRSRQSHGPWFSVPTKSQLSLLSFLSLYLLSLSSSPRIPTTILIYFPIEIGLWWGLRPHWLIGEETTSASFRRWRTRVAASRGKVAGGRRRWRYRRCRSSSRFAVKSSPLPSSASSLRRETFAGYAPF